MKKVIITAIIILVLGGVLIYANRKNQTKTFDDIQSKQINNPSMQIISSAFGDNQTIPVKYTCDGDGVNPPLEFKDVPPGAQTLALIMDDPDAPMGIWVHWVLWNIPPQTNTVFEDSQKFGTVVQGKTSSGQNNYGGPCPPSGTHRYFFKLYALDSKLAIPSYSGSLDLEKAMQGHILAQAQLIGLYSRNK